MNTDKIHAESIAKEYAPQSASKVTALKKLDRKAKRPAQIFTWMCGVVSTLVMGTGMCLSMHVIGTGSTAATAAGGAVGLAGIFGMCANYPLYRLFLENGKSKYAFEIMELAKEIAEE